MSMCVCNSCHEHRVSACVAYIMYILCIIIQIIICFRYVTNSLPRHAFIYSIMKYIVINNINRVNTISSFTVPVNYQ